MVGIIIMLLELSVVIELFYIYRNATRMVHVPFLVPMTDVPSGNHAVENLRDAYCNASSSIGELIAIGRNSHQHTCRTRWHPK